jgi:hypothetical protein
VVVADSQTLQVDLDVPFEQLMPAKVFLAPERFDNVYRLLASEFPVPYGVYPSRNGNTHILLRLPEPWVFFTRRIAWQLALGSDPMREALSLMSFQREEVNPLFLYMRKDRPRFW